MVCLCVASSTPASLSSPSVTFSKPWDGTISGSNRQNNEIMWSLEIKAHNKRQKSLLNIHIPLDHNIHFLVSLCTGTGHSVSATRRWSDCSCLNSRERRDTDYIPHAHACTCILTAQVLERCTIGEQSDRALL